MIFAKLIILILFSYQTVFALELFEKPIKPFEVINPIPEIERKRTETESQRQVKEPEEKAETEEKTGYSRHEEQLKAICSFQWCKVSCKDKNCRISGMVSDISVRERINCYCRANNLKCTVELVKIQY